MRNEINSNDLERVTGGTVYLNEMRNMCGFDTLGEKYELKCKFSDARNTLFSLMAKYPDMGERQFDTLVRDTYRSNGWI